MDVLIVVAGLAGLWYGTQLTVRGAVCIANRMGMSEFIVGAAILSVGSDIPELGIAIDASIRNSGVGNLSGVVVGTAIGSSLGQIGLVLGLVGLFGCLTLPKQVVYQHGGVMLGSIALLALAGLDGFISRTEGASLVAVYLIYFIFILTSKPIATPDPAEDADLSRLKSWTLLVIGLLTVGVGSEITVYSITRIADSFSINQGLLAIFLIGIGSSLPELSISIGAVVKKKAQLSAGNLVGSNIFDTLVPIGIGATISTLEFDRTMLTFDLPAVFILSAVALFYFGHVKGIQKREAAILIGIYFVYAFFRVAIEL